MNKKMIIGALILAILLIAGAAAYITSQDEDQSAKEENQSTQQEIDNQNANNQNQAENFDVASTEGLSFVSTISTTSEGKTTTATMEYDKTTGSVRYTSQAEGQDLVMIYTKDAYYMCQTAETCIKYPTSQGDTSGFDSDSYQYSENELNDIKSSAFYQGQKDCLSGTCDVWKSTLGDYESLMYIDAKTKRIVQVESTSAAGSSKITYEYKDVSIVPPTNVQTIPGL